MSVQDFIKKSILESGAFDGAGITNIALGLITALIRIYGSNPEGVSYAIL